MLTKECGTALKGDGSDSTKLGVERISMEVIEVIEYTLLPVLNKSISISPHQLGYQQQSSTILANVLLKETINEYIAAKSSVFFLFY